MTPRPPKKLRLASPPALVGKGREAPPQRRAGSGKRAPSPSGRGSWLLPPLLVAAVACSVLLVRGDLSGHFGLTFGLLVALGLGWVLVSVFFPARADRRCQSCGSESLERLDPQSTQGLRCSSCGWCDAEASAWLIAEEEGPLEHTVLRQRGRELSPPRPSEPRA
jgi:ribosomal protein L37AE/L43A